MLHAQAMRKAGDEFADLKRIDREFSALMQREERDSHSENSAAALARTIDNEFFYNIALACQDDAELQKDIMRIESHSDDSKIMTDSWRD
jgi:hypothetical protein